MHVRTFCFRPAQAVFQNGRTSIAYSVAQGAQDLPSVMAASMDGEEAALATHETLVNLQLRIGSSIPCQYVQEGFITRTMDALFEQIMALKNCNICNLSVSAPQEFLYEHAAAASMSHQHLLLVATCFICNYECFTTRMAITEG